MTSGHFVTACACGCRRSAEVRVLRTLERAGVCLVQSAHGGIMWRVRRSALVWVPTTVARSAA